MFSAASAQLISSVCSVYAMGIVVLQVLTGFQEPNVSQVLLALDIKSNVSQYYYLKYMNYRPNVSQALLINCQGSLQLLSWYDWLTKIIAQITVLKFCNCFPTACQLHVVRP